MTKAKRKAPALSDAEEKRIQAGISADPDNPEWNAQDFRRAKPFTKAFPMLAKSRRIRGVQKQPAKIVVSLRLTRARGAASSREAFVRRLLRFHVRAGADTRHPPPTTSRM
jgi:hypothetical protein